MSYSSSKTIPAPDVDKNFQAPSRLQRVTQIVKRLLAVVAALDSAEAITLRDKSRILSAQLKEVPKETANATGQILDYPQRPDKVRPCSRSDRLAG